MLSHILIVEDDPQISNMIQFAMESKFRITSVIDIEAALNVLSKIEINLILLDWMLPGLTGIELMRRLKRTKNSKNIPIIMLTAKSEESDKLKGFANGADDFVTKPFSIYELEARIKAVLHRTRATDTEPKFSSFQLLPEEKKVIIQGEEIKVTKKEFNILEYLYNKKNRVCTRDGIIESCWDNDDVTDRVIDVNIRRIRKKLEPYGSKVIIDSVRGFGYKLLEKD
ncbi:response regulator transcription factor [Pseudomonadota bacterium]|nr:response regulator transcription factor [Pseudomonadota bacterium]